MHHYLFDLSLTTIHVSDCSYFSDINILQGSVATRVRLNGFFNDTFTTNLLLSLQVKGFEKLDNI